MILFNFATRSRPKKMWATYQSIVRFHKGLFLFKIDYDDEATLNSHEFKLLQHEPNCIIYMGNSNSKVHAINRDIPLTKWNVLVNVSDDQIFYNYHDIESDFNGDYDKFIHYPDGYVNERLCTMSVMGIDYYKRFGYVYHPDYVSLWCDNEAQEVAQALGKYTYNPVHFFKHEHPFWTGQQKDDLLRSTEKWYRVDEKTYQKRKSLGFPIS